MRVYKLVNFSIEGLGGSERCFSSYSPVMGLLWRKMKWTYRIKPMQSAAETKACTNKTNLGTRACQVRTKHDGPWSLVRELLAFGLEAILKKLDVASTAVATLLVFDFILHHQWFVAEVNGMLKRRRNGVMGSLSLSYETLVTFDDDSGRLLNLPFADVAEGFTANWSLLSGLRRSPPLRPVIRELLKERSLDLSGL